MPFRTDTTTVYNKYIPQPNMIGLPHSGKYIKENALDTQMGSAKLYGSDVSHFIPQYFLYLNSKNGNIDNGYQASNVSYFNATNNRNSGLSVMDNKYNAFHNYLKKLKDEGRIDDIKKSSIEAINMPVIFEDKNPSQRKINEQLLSKYRMYRVNTIDDNGNPMSEFYRVNNNPKAGLIQSNADEWNSSVNRLVDMTKGKLRKFDYNTNSKFGQYILGRDY